MLITIIILVSDHSLSLLKPLHVGNWFSFCLQVKMISTNTYSAGFLDKATLKPCKSTVITSSFRNVAIQWTQWNNSKTVDLNYAFTDLNNYFGCVKSWLACFRLVPSYDLLTFIMSQFIYHKVQSGDTEYINIISSTGYQMPRKLHVVCKGFSWW